MSTILINTNSRESAPLADDEFGTTEPQAAAHGPHTVAPAAGNHSDRDDTESDDASFVSAPVMASSLERVETNDTPHSGASTQAGFDPGDSQVSASEPARQVEEVNGEDQNMKNQDHTCGCQSQKLTGWAAVEKTLTDFDREEVGGYKEDIDSLLTFAGLYSGVLTAFVIVSFTQLSEDTATESLRVLRIIANQTSGNAVSSPPMLTDPSPFQPSLAAKRVNVLWFASLVISLSTASFSILVKQWLRSYLAFASSSPQGALRIRHFRRAGLEAWRVFGIASMLPFLLQISLALFFVGLCFFTADIDPTIGNTTLPLVCAWAFLFLAVTLTPIFSANCPYKTPAVSPVTTALRCYVGHTLARWARQMPLLLLILSLYFVQTVFRVTGSIMSFLARQGVSGITFDLRVEGFRSGMVGLWVQGFNRVSLEEADVRILEWDDMAILITADAIQATAEPDMMTLEAALKQTNQSWEDTVIFLLRIIGNRVPLSTDAWVQLPVTVLDCSSLSPRARENILDLFQRYIINHLPVVAGSARRAILIVWAMAIHISLHDRHAQIPEPLLASIDGAIIYLKDYYHWHESTSPSLSGQLALAMCCRITHDDIRAGRADKIRFAVQMILLYSFALKNRSMFVPGNTSSFAVVFKDAARCLVNNLEQEIMDSGHTLSATVFEEATRLVINLYVLSRRYQNRGDEDEIQHEDRLEPLVIRAFNQRSWRTKRAILNVLCPVLDEPLAIFGVAVESGLFHFHLSIGFHADDSDSMRYCKFLRNILSHNGTAEHNLMEVILQFVAIPIDKTGWKDIIRRSVGIIKLLELSSPESRRTDGPSWRRIFLVLARQMHSLVHLSSEQDFFKLAIGLSEIETVHDELDSCIYFSLPRLIKTHCGLKIDQMLKLQAASDTSGGDQPNPTAQPGLENRSRRTQSYIPDYFCLTLGRFTEPKSRFWRPDGAQSPVWTARHLRNISTEERDRIVEEEEREMEAIGIDAIIADARESYID